MPPRTSSNAFGQGIPAPPAESRPGTCPSDPDDDLLAALLIRMWSLASGRTLRRDIPPGQLSEQELISFWADDMSPPAGRHVLPYEPGPTVAECPARALRSEDGLPFSARSQHNRRESPADQAAA
ncbi:MAG TPA: hypothetical protein VHZ03_26530 [Trebonia sp.]|jgi:hypothetical protein|nr:hypothetical protein [Trebonia sp.]